MSGFLEGALDKKIGLVPVLPVSSTRCPPKFVLTSAPSIVTSLEIPQQAHQSEGASELSGLYALAINLDSLLGKKKK